MDITRPDLAVSRKRRRYETQARDIQIGLAVTIDTRNGKRATGNEEKRR